MTNNRLIKNLTTAGVIAGLYVAFTFVSYSFGLSGNVIQLRLSEALCILPYFTVTAIPGLFVGCVLSNILTGCALFDIIIGSLATLIGAAGTYWISHIKIKKDNTGIRRKSAFIKLISTLPPILSNSLLLPPVLSYIYGATQAMPVIMLTIFIEESICIGLLGFLLLKGLEKYQHILFE